LTLFSFEIWCSLGDEELSRSNLDVTTFSINEAGSLQMNNVKNSKIKKTNKYFQTLFDQLFDICVNYINVESEEEEDSWDISKACHYILKILVQLAESEKIEKLLNYIMTNVDNENLLVKNSCLLIFGASVDSYNKAQLWELAKIYFEKILKTMEHENPRIRKSATYLLFKVTKNFGKNLSTSHIESIIAKCIGMINYNNKNSIKICSIFSNLIKARGDPNTVKNDSKF